MVGIGIVLGAGLLCSCLLLVLLLLSLLWSLLLVSYSVVVFGGDGCGNTHIDGDDTWWKLYHQVWF